MIWCHVATARFLRSKGYLCSTQDKYFPTFTIATTVSLNVKSCRPSKWYRNRPSIVSRAFEIKKVFTLSCTSHMSLSVSSWNNSLRILAIGDSWNFHLYLSTTAIHKWTPNRVRIKSGCQLPTYNTDHPLGYSVSNDILLLKKAVIICCNKKMKSSSWIEKSSSQKGVFDGQSSFSSLEEVGFLC